MSRNWSVYLAETGILTFKQELIGHAGGVKLECSEHYRAWERKKELDAQEYASQLGGERLNVPHLEDN
jgi:hypothetical protein